MIFKDNAFVVGGVGGCKVKCPWAPGSNSLSSLHTEMGKDFIHS